jgi:DNA-binding XRE family transcriptional regulator
MIENERQYNITRAQIRKFEAALRELRAAQTAPTTLLQRAQIAGMESQLADLRAEVEDYEGLRDGSRGVIECASLEAIPDVLIRGRIAAGLTQRQLGSVLGLKEQQVQRYESSRYASASLSRVIEVGRALGLRFLQPASFSVRRAVAKSRPSALLRVAEAAPDRPYQTGG